MKIKKRLDYEAKISHQKILEDSDKDFLCSLKERVSKPKHRPLFFHWKAWITGATCTVAAAFIIVCAVLLVPSQESMVYYEKNFISSDSDVNAMNIDLKDFRMELEDDVMATNLQRTIDGPSGDLLYYEVTLQTIDNRIRAKITITCNQNFNYNGELPPTLSYQQEELCGYPILYSITPTFGSNPQYVFLQAYAEIKGENNIIYITDYQEVSLDENGSFLEFIQSLIKVKE